MCNFFIVYHVFHLAQWKDVFRTFSNICDEFFAKSSIIDFDRVLNQSLQWLQLHQHNNVKASHNNPKLRHAFLEEYFLIKVKVLLILNRLKFYLTFFTVLRYLNTLVPRVYILY